MRRAAGSGLTTAIILVAMLTGASAAAAKTHPAKTHAQRGLGVLIPKSKGERLPLHGGTADSLNWSGYAVTPTGGGVTAVSSTFTVPSAGPVPPGFAATWTGIGGYNTSDLIQAGNRRAVRAGQPAPRRPVLGVVRAAARERDAADRLHRGRQLHGHPGRQHHGQHQPGVR